MERKKAKNHKRYRQACTLCVFHTHNVEKVKEESLTAPRVSNVCSGGGGGGGGCGSRQ